jgi:hypothetical protein
MSLMAVLGWTGALATWPAAGALVYVNVADVGFTPTSTVAQAKYRLSQNNFDQSLDNGSGTSNTANFISSNLGNSSNTASNISGVTFNFVLDYKIAEGFTYSMTNTRTGLTSTLRWGEFASGTGTTAATLGGFAPNRAFNSLLIETRATQTQVRPTFNLSGLTFQSMGTTSQGSFVDELVTPLYSQTSSTPGFGLQRLVSDTNLADLNFTLTGQFTATRLERFSSDEQLKVTIFAQNGTASIPTSTTSSTFIPEPGCLAIAGIAALGLGRRRI